MGILIILVDIGFAIWASSGKAWYFYLINFALLFAASSIINTSFIQGFTRGWSYISLYGARGILDALRINLITVVYVGVAFLITWFVFSEVSQFIYFFGICFLLSFIVAFNDDKFREARERTRMFEDFRDKNNF